MCSLQQQLKSHWLPALDNPALPVLLSSECRECIVCWRHEERWPLGVPLKVSSPSALLYTDLLLTGWGAYLLNLLVAGVWSWEERELHINVLDMNVA